MFQFQVLIRPRKKHGKSLTSLKVNIALLKANNYYFYSAKKTSSIVITLWHHYSEIWMQKKIVTTKFLSTWNAIKNAEAGIGKQQEEVKFRGNEICK